MWVSSRTLEELLGRTTAEELLGIPNEIVLIVSGQPAEPHLLVSGHG
jgi:hypothetical protein